CRGAEPPTVVGNLVVADKRTRRARWAARPGDPPEPLHTTPRGADLRGPPAPLLAPRPRAPRPGARPRRAGDDPHGGGAHPRARGPGRRARGDDGRAASPATGPGTRCERGSARQAVVISWPRPRRGPGAGPSPCPPRRGGGWAAG